MVRPDPYKYRNFPLFLEQVRAHGWELKKLFLTHSHADHVAGAAFLREQTGCEVCAPGISAAAVEHSFLIPVTLYGGSTTPEMCSRLLTPPPCACSELSGDALPPGLDFERLDGHDMAQAAFRTQKQPGTACGSRRTP